MSFMQDLGITPYHSANSSPRLPQWSFASQNVARLCSWGHFLRNERGVYRIQARFSDGKSVYDHPLPLRFLRRLAIGTEVYRGFPDYDTDTDATIRQIPITPSECKTLLLKECPQWLQSHCGYQDENDPVGEQQIMRFRQRDQLYFFPVMEFARKAYIAHGLHCNDIIHAGKMASGIGYKEQQGDTLLIHLQRQYKKAYIKRATAIFLARYCTINAFRHSFDSVAINTVLRQTGNKVPLKCQLPACESMTLCCSLVSQQKKHWIQRIIDIRGISLPVKNIVICQGAKRSCFKLKG